jgi:hypothetical protein
MIEGFPDIEKKLSFTGNGKFILAKRQWLSPLPVQTRV